jgi:hypothetical protein
MYKKRELNHGSAELTSSLYATKLKGNASRMKHPEEEKCARLPTPKRYSSTEKTALVYSVTSQSSFPSPGNLGFGLMNASFGHTVCVLVFQKHRVFCGEHR